MTTGHDLDIFKALPEDHQRMVAELWETLERLAALPGAPPGVHGISQELLDVYGIRYSDLPRPEGDESRAR